MRYELDRPSAKAPASRGAARELRQIDDQALVMAAREIRAVQVVEAKTRQRIRSNHSVGRSALTETAITDMHIGALSQGNPALEMMMRVLQQTLLACDQESFLQFQEDTR
jgi:hypothetical protein